MASSEIDIQDEYDQLISAMTPAQRVARSEAMFRWTREMIARQILAHQGDTPAEELKWQVAFRQYQSEPAVTAMIQRVLDRVSS